MNKFEVLNKSELAKQIYKVAHLTGEFKLRSGKISHEYFDKYRFEAKPQILDQIAQHMLALIPKDTEVLAGLEMGGIPIATALSLKSGIPALFVRKKAKDYGTCKIAEGGDFKNKKVCIIEDVVTTGGQVVLSTKDLREAGAIVNTVLCVINRGEKQNQSFKEIGLNLIPLFNRDEFE